MSSCGEFIHGIYCDIADFVGFAGEEAEKLYPLLGQTSFRRPYAQARASSCQNQSCMGST